MSLILQHWQYLTTPGTYPGVDFLRAVAVAMVVLFHSFVLPFGWIGVDIFFVLSGFLIGGAILDKALVDRFSFARFYGHRALRILPVYYFTILMCAVTKARDLNFDKTAWKSILTGVLFLQTTGPYFFPEFFLIDNRYIPGGSWSLVIEEMFYLFAPLLLICALALTRKRLLLVFWISAAAASSGLAVRYLVTSGFAPDDSNWFFANFVQFHSRYDELAWGVVAAVVVRQWPNVARVSSALLPVGGVMLVAFIAFLFSNNSYWNKPSLMTGATIWVPTVLGVAFCTILLGWYHRGSGGRAIVILARLSYPVYLVHLMLPGKIWKSGGPEVLAWLDSGGGVGLRLATLYTLTLMLSYLVSLCVEFPFVRLYRYRSSKTDASIKVPA